MPSTELSMWYAIQVLAGPSNTIQKDPLFLFC